MNCLIVGTFRAVTGPNCFRRVLRVVASAVLAGQIQAANYQGGYKTNTTSVLSNQSAPSAPGGYLVMDLGTDRQPIAVNNHGTVLLQKSTTPFNPYRRKTVNLAQGVEELLVGTTSRPRAAGLGLNNNDEVWGYVRATTGFAPQAAYWFGFSTTPQLWFPTLPVAWTGQTTVPYFFSDNRRFWTERTGDISETTWFSHFSSVHPDIPDEFFAEYSSAAYDQGDEIEVGYVAESGDMVGFYYRRDGSLVYDFVGRHPQTGFRPIYPIFSGSKINSRGLALLHQYQPGATNAVGSLYLWDLAKPDTYRLIGTARSSIPSPGRAPAFLGVNTPKDDRDPLIIVNDTEIMLENLDDGSAELSLQRYTAASLLPTGSPWQNFRAKTVSNNGRYIIGQANDATGVIHAVLLIKLDPIPTLAVDANRDGTIKLASEDASDATSAVNPYRFWLNDDDDGNALNDEQEVYGGTAKDYESRGDFGIASKRDLEDFARLWLSAKGMTAALKNGELQLGFKWADGYTGTPKINLYLHYEADGGTKYLTDTPIAIGQASNPWSATLVSTTTKNLVAPGDVFVLKKEVFASLTEELPTAHFLFEGAGEGKGQMQMMILDRNGVPIGEGPGVWMDFKNIQSMYQRVKVTPRDPDGIPKPYRESTTFDASTADTEPFDNNYPLQVPPDETQSALVFVHGSNIAYEEARWNAETMFKRLYWQGYKGRFVLFYWDTLVGAFDGEIPALPYNLNEYRALKYGPALKNYVSTLSQGRTVNVASHSLGAAVMISALKQGMVVNNYLVLQGAFSAKSYDVSLPALQRFQDAETGKPTPDMALDLGYGGYLANVQGTLINMFNPFDFALATGTTVGVETNWEINQVDSKPDDPVGVGQYSYFSGLPVGYTGPIPLGGSVYYSIFQAAIRAVTDPHESMAFVARTRTKAVGALTGVGGAISQEINLGEGTVYDFGRSRPDHSAEFTRNIQVLQPFYRFVFERTRQP